MYNTHIYATHSHSRYVNVYNRIEVDCSFSELDVNKERELDSVVAARFVTLFSRT